MEDYDQVLRAVGYFTHRHGKIDRIDSFNEHWLDLEAFHTSVHALRIGSICGVEHGVMRTPIA